MRAQKRPKDFAQGPNPTKEIKTYIIYIYKRCGGSAEGSGKGRVGASVIGSFSDNLRCGNGAMRIESRRPGLKAIVWIGALPEGE